MELLLEQVASLDAHRDTVVACARFPRPTGHGRASQTREFMTTQSELALLGAWLTELAITDVAMKATGVYWVPVFSALEHNFEVVLVIGASMKNVPGRKTGMAETDQRGLDRAYQVGPGHPRSSGCRGQGPGRPG